LDDKHSMNNHTGGLNMRWTLLALTMAAAVALGGCFEGKQGPAGPAGAQGAQGAKGDKGDAGAQGVAGAVGAVGARGEKGEKGDAGAAGAQGLAGSAGARGERGEKGDKGDRGDKGDKGDAGVSTAASFRVPPATAARASCNADEVMITAMCVGSSTYQALSFEPQGAQCGSDPASTAVKVAIVCAKR
jgi:hypothetical protein